MTVNLPETMGIFIDLENITDTVSAQLPSLMNKLYKKGDVVFRKAYGKWSSPYIQSFQKLFNTHGFELVHHYHPVNGKNSADIQMTVDVMFYACSANSPQCFVLVGSDADFSPLYRRLREMGKRIIGVGKVSPLSKSVATSCNEFIYLPESPQKVISPPAEKPSLPVNKPLPVVNLPPPTPKLGSPKKEIPAPDFPPYPLEPWLTYFIYRTKMSVSNLDLLQEFLMRSHPVAHIKNISQNDLISHCQQIKTVRVYKNRNMNYCILKVPEDSEISLHAQEKFTHDFYMKLIRHTEWKSICAKDLRSLYEHLSRYGPKTQGALQQEHFECTKITSLNYLIKLNIIQTKSINEAAGTPSLPEALLFVDTSTPFEETLRTLDLNLITYLLRKLMDPSEFIDETVIEGMLCQHYDAHDYQRLFVEAQEKAFHPLHSP